MINRKDTTYYIFIYLLLLFLQITAFRNVLLIGYAVPLLIVYFFIKLPFSISVNKILTMAFVTGIIVDMFYSTPGVYALSLTITAFMRRPYIILVINQSEKDLSVIPSIRTFGFAPFSVYAVLTVFTFSTIVFIAHSFSIFEPINIIFRIFASTLLTYLLVIIFEKILPK